MEAPTIEELLSLGWGNGCDSLLSYLERKMKRHWERYHIVPWSFNMPEDQASGYMLLDSESCPSDDRQLVDQDLVLGLQLTLSDQANYLSTATTRDAMVFWVHRWTEQHENIVRLIGKPLSQSFIPTAAANVPSGLPGAVTCNIQVIFTLRYNAPPPD